MKPKRLILCRSQNEAITIGRRLNQCGINGKLVRPPQSGKTTSCTWGIEIDRRQTEQAKHCLERAGVPNEQWCWEDNA